ncbi:MAG: starch-binding protein [Flavobacteriaceae bacterium]
MKQRFTSKNRLLTMICFVLFAWSNVSGQSAANVNDIMLQAFGWDVHTQASVSAEGGLYNFLKNRTSGYASVGFNVIWLPPPSKSTGGVGYIPTELFNFSQTVYGSETQLRALLTAMNTSSPRIHPMADVVVNHRGGTTNWTDFTNPTWDCHSITSTDEANYGTITGYRPCGTADTGEGFNGARDLDHTNLQVQNGVKEYLTRLKGLGFDSWRWDVAKGFSASYFGDYINSSSPYASVGEYWDGNVNALKAWINGTGNRSAAFDFALYYNALQPAINSGNYAALAGYPGLAGQYGYADKAVTFIDNHDTFVKPGSFVTSDNIMKGYAFILTHPGIPCVFFPHYNGGTYSKDGVTVTYASNKTAIDKLMAIRRNNGINAYSSVVVSNSGSFYSATIDNKVVVKIGPGLWNPGTGWVLKTSGTDYAVWEKEVVVDTPSLTISPAGGSFTAGTTINTVLTANNSTSTIYYTTDGSTPTTASASAVGTKTLAITSTTTLKAFVRNTAGTSSAVSTQTYTFTAAPTFTVYFKKPSNWGSSIKIYYWNVTGTATAVTWPGVAMTLDCGSWYKFTFPSTVSAANLIFNDGSLQTADLSATAGTKFYDNGWLASEPANRCPTSMTVYFKPPSNWTVAPKIYYWNALPTGSAANATWPGFTMTPDVNGFYKYTIVGPTSVNIVFNNGNSGTGNQTADLLNKSNGYSYTWGAAARMSDDIQSNITTYPNPVVDILQIQSETKVLQYKIVSMQGAVLKEGKPNENSIDLSPLVSGIYFIQMTDENGQTKMQRIVKK